MFSEECHYCHLIYLLYMSRSVHRSLYPVLLAVLPHHRHASIWRTAPRWRGQIAVSVPSSMCQHLSYPATFACALDPITPYWCGRLKPHASTRCHELSLPLNRVCTGQSSDSEGARGQSQWQCADVTLQVNLSFSVVSCIAKKLIECIAIESS